MHLTQFNSRAVTAVVCLLGLLTLGLPSASQAQTQTQPRVVQIFPASDTPLPDQAVFALKLSKHHSGKPQAQCDVWGIRSSIPTEVIPSPRREAVLKAYGISEGDAMMEPWIVLRCQTTFPDAARVTLRWLNPERADFNSSDDPLNSFGWDGQRFNFTAQSDWPVAIQCNRSNASAGCSPLEPVTLNFNGRRIHSNQLQQVLLKDSKGKTIQSVQALSLDKQSAMGTLLTFAKLSAEETYQVVWPSKLETSDGKPVLTDKAKSRMTTAPLTVRIGNYPPLVKFTANFGITEKAIGGIVPLTVRSVEAAPEAPVKLRQLKLNDEASIIEVMQTLMRVTNLDGSGSYTGYSDDGDGEPTPTAAANASKLRYPFAFPKPKQPTDTRGQSWLKNIKTTTVGDLPKQLEGTAFEVLGVPLKESGLYVLEAESLFLGRSLLDKNRPMYVRSGALVTDLGVHLHTSDRTAAVWVASLSSGKPVANAQVGIWDCKAKKIANGVTNDQGWTQLDARYERRWNCPLFAFAKTDADIGFVQSNWQRGIESWRFETLKNLHLEVGAKAVHTVLARNLLRAGETLQAKIFWRAINTKGELALPRRSDLPNTVKLSHVGSGESVSVPVTWDVRGHAQVTYKIPEGAKRGAYEIQVLGNSNERWNAPSSTQYRVEDFRLPVLKSEVVSPVKSQFMGDKIDVLLRLAYLSGGVAAGERVGITQRLLKHTPRYPLYSQFNFGRFDNYWSQDSEDAISMEAEETAQAVPDGADDKSYTLNGNGTLTLSTKLKKAATEPRTLLTEIEYRDPNGETYRAQGRTVVWPANVVLGSKMDYWASGTTRKVEFMALTPDGKPAANVPIQVMGGFKGYVYHRRRNVGGYYGYSSEQRDDKPVSLCSGRSNAQGAFVCEFKPAMTGDKIEGEIDSGQFAITATASDAQNRKSVHQTSMWLYGGGEVWFDQGDHDRMDVIAEKPNYKPGETATLQVRSPFREATAWVNVMRSGAVVDTLVVPLSGKNPVIKLPIKDSYAPNAFINVLAVRGRVAEPAATALVDLARPAFKLGLTEISVNGNQNELKVKVSTDKTAYQSRETAIAQISVTPANGQALPADRDATVFAIDEALLELLPNNTWDVLKTMLAERGYGFESASANMQVMGKRHYGRKALPAGGGGGKSAARELFDTLLLWQGTVRLDAEGKATVRIPINDSLTRFRVVAVANAGASLFGTGQASFTATKDLQVLSGLPLTAREGDRFSAGFTVRNTTANAMTTSVNAKLGDIQLTEQKLSLAAGEAKTISWLVDVPLDAKQLNWRIEAKSDTGRSDVLVLKQTVQTPYNALRFGVAAQSLVDGALQTFSVNPPSNAVAGKGEVRVSLSPAFATDAAGIRDYMRSYPFYCLEQRTSKAVALKDKALWDIIYNTLPQYVTESGLVNYYPDQNGYDQGYDVLTSFVLSAAHEAKFALPKEAQSKMLKGLEQFVTGKLERRYEYYGNDDGYGLTERKLLALEALARYQKIAPALTDSLKLHPSNDLPKLTSRALVQWIDVVHRSDWTNKSERMDAALKGLKNRFSVNRDGERSLKNDPRENRWYWMYSDETTLARLALLALDVPELKDDAESLTRAALKTQRVGHWWQTQANVWGSLMLDKRAVLAAGAIGGTTQLEMGGSKSTHDWQKQPQGETYTFSLSSNNNGGAAKTLAVQHQGAGKPYVQALGTAWSDLKEASSSNASVSRSVKAIKQQVTGQYSAGDVLEVRVQFGVRNGMGWVAVTDPIPTGATLLGNGLKGMEAVATGTERRGWRNSDGTYEAYPAYIERTATVIRAYYEYLWYGENTLTYQVRINNPGIFKLPATQVEAMYDPSVYAYRPNSVMTITAAPTSPSASK